ncbi:MAG: STM4013/SEN3800 family hydrolase [Tannerellaceae bacterium]|nr:STM4013/SEN3800 family hydrolase [Tannerellaceae bacterium]
MDQINMNEVVGKQDILMLCFDTLRYDICKEEEKKGTIPVLNSYGGPFEKRHAPGTFTYPSHFAIFAGFFPSPAEPEQVRERHSLFFPERAGTGRIAHGGSYSYREATFVESLANRGYETICIGGVHFFSKRNAIGKVFPSYFKKSYWRTSFGCTEKDSAEKQIDHAIRLIEKYPATQRLFMYINFSAIHYPNFFYVEGKKEDDPESHAAAFRYVDRLLPRLFEAFRKRSQTLVIALSDHGTCYGEEGYRNHGIAHEVVYTVPYKHFILD